jgi:hypothetical protein
MMRKYIFTLNEVFDIHNLILESFEDAIEKFADEPMIEYDQAKSYVDQFKVLRVSKPKAMFDNIRGVTVPVNIRHDITAYKSFDQLKKVIDHINQTVQDKSKTAKLELEIKGDKVFDSDKFAVYYMDSKEKCQAYLWNKELSGIRYKHCIGWVDTSNQFGNYNKTKDFTIYLVQDKVATRRELDTGEYEPPFKDKWHMSVVMVRDKGGLEYQISNADNPGGESIGSWENILKQCPRLSVLDKNIFKVRSGEVEKNWLDDITSPLSDLEYKQLEYHFKAEYINTKCNIDFQLTDQQFILSPDALKQVYIGLMIPLSDKQLESIRDNEKLLKWYFVNLTRKWGHVLSRENVVFDEKFVNSLESRFEKITIEGNVNQNDLVTYINKYLKLSPLNLDLLKRYQPKLFEMYGEIMKKWYAEIGNNAADDNKFYWYVVNGNPEEYAHLIGSRLSTGKLVNNANLLYLRNKFPDMFKNYAKYLLQGMIVPGGESAVVYIYNHIELFSDTIKQLQNDKEIVNDEISNKNLQKLIAKM